MRHHLFPILADALESAGFPLGVDWHLRVRQLLAQIPENTSDDQLRDALCTITARDPESQERFHEIFKQSLLEWKRREAEYNLTLPTPKSTERHDDAEPDTPPVSRRGTWPIKRLLLLTFLLAGGLVWWWSRMPDTPEIIVSPIDVFAGRDTIVVPDTNVVRSFGTPAAARFENSTDTVRATALADYALRDSGRVWIKTRDTLGSDTLLIRLENKSGKTRLWQIITQVSRTEELASMPIASTRRIKHTLDYLPDERTARENLLLKLRAPETSALQILIAKYHWPLKTALFLLLAGALYLLVQWRERNRPLTAARESTDQPPYVWNIKLDDERPLEFNDTFYTTANRLRRRETTDTRRLDLPRTIRATIERGGLPEFRYRDITRPPEYLLLIDRQDTNDHRAALFDAIAAAFKKQEVLLDRFFFNGDPRLCWNEEHPNGLGIRDLLYRYPAARLLVLSDGYRMLGTGKLAPWTQVLDAWKQRALLSPVPPANWHLAERRLAERFTVLPALLDSLNFLSELDQHVETGLFPLTGPTNAKSQADNPADEPPVSLGGPLIPTLRQYYTDAQIRWIAACAVWPSLHYDLTVWLGRWLRTDSPRSRTSRSTLSLTPHLGEGLRIGLHRLRRLFTPRSKLHASNSLTPNSTLTADDLRQLARLEWFVEGRIPDHDRITLLEWLEQDSPGLLRRIQGALYRLLAVQKAPDPKSVASPGYRMHLALLGWMSAANSAERARHAEEFKKLIGRTRPDVTALKALNRRTLLDVLIPRQLHPGGFPALGWTPFWRDAAIAVGSLILTLIGGLLWQPATPDTCRGEQVQYQNQTLCLQTAAHHALYRERLACEMITRQNDTSQLQIVDTLTMRVRTWSPPGDTARAAYEHYVATALYNKGVQFAHRADTLTAEGASEPEKDGISESHSAALRALRAVEQGAAYRAARDLACAYFRSALATDSTLAEARRGLAWCNDPSSLTPDADGRYADERARYLVPMFRDFFAQKGYVFEENYPNIIGFRKTQNRVKDAWEDWLVVLFKNPNGVWESRIYTATTMPGLSAVMSADAAQRGGAAMLAPGQYPNAYTPGLHQPDRSSQVQALRQTGVVAIYRDKNESGNIDPSDTRKRKDYYGLNIHPVTLDNVPAKVGNWSYGTIVLPRKSEWADFQPIYETAYAAQKRPFALTLVTQEEAPDIGKYLFSTASLLLPSSGQSSTEGNIEAADFQKYNSSIYYIRANRVVVEMDGIKDTIDDYQLGGTGFLMSDGRFVTARHLIEPWYYFDVSNPDAAEVMLNIIANTGGRVDIEFTAYSTGGKQMTFKSSDFRIDRSTDERLSITDPNSEKQVLVTHANLNDGTDWAVIRGQGSGSIIPNADLSKSLPSGASLVVSGFPYGLGVGQNIEPVMSQYRTTMSGMKNGVIVVTGSGFELGNSGSPVFYSHNGQDYVIGLVSAKVSSVLYLVPIARVR